MLAYHKPNEDFGYYHLPYLINFTSEKVIFGLSTIHTNQGWNSMWLNLMATYKLPVISINGFHLANLIFFIFFSIIFCFELLNFKSSISNSNNLIKFFCLNFYLYFLLKFSRLNTYGFDVPSNFIAVYCFYLLLIYFNLEKKDFEKKNYIFNKILLFSFFSATIKLSNALICLLPIFILLQVVESEATNNYNQNVTSANTYVQSGNTSLGDVNNIVNNSTDFLKVFKSFNVEVVSRIGAIFLSVLYEELKKDILNLLGSIIIDVVKTQKLKKYKIILRLINILLILSQLVDDYRKCKSLINSILQLLQLIFGRPDGSIPLPLLFLTQFLPGYSPERSSINTIELLQSVGIPTGPLPDGSPNLMGIYNLMSNIGVDNEESDNGKTEGTVITPLGIYPVYSKEA